MAGKKKKGRSAQRKNAAIAIASGGSAATYFDVSTD
jgi:hypothetical protein